MRLPQHETRDEAARLAQVYVTSGLYQAEIIRGKLETNGIPVLLRYESLGPVMGLTVDGLGQVQVWVPLDLEDQARELLQEDDPLPDDFESDSADETT
jgi:hypothetical protein